MIVDFTGSSTTAPLTIPNHPHLKSSTSRTILTQTGISIISLGDNLH